MTPSVKFITLVLASSLCAGACAQVAFSLQGQYAQFRNLSALPGGTFGVNRDGDPDMRGALAISTPIAYSLHGGHFAVVGSNTSYDGKFRFPRQPTRSDYGTKSNGTATVMAGASSSIGDFSFGMDIVSGAFESCINTLFTPKQPKQALTLAVGAQGLFSAGGLVPGFHRDADRATSVFGVGTLDLGHGAFVSAGDGTSRYSKGFVNASVGIGPKARLAVEQDGFGWNYGVGAEVGVVKLGRSGDVRLNAFLGSIQCRYAFWSLGMTF